jgi:hypothetical protein
MAPQLLHLARAASTLFRVGRRMLDKELSLAAQSPDPPLVALHLALAELGAANGLVGLLFKSASVPQTDATGDQVAPPQLVLPWLATLSKALVSTWGSSTGMGACACSAPRRVPLPLCQALPAVVPFNAHCVHARCSIMPAPVHDVPPPVCCCLPAAAYGTAPCCRPCPACLPAPVRVPPALPPADQKNVGYLMFCASLAHMLLSIDCFSGTAQALASLPDTQQAIVEVLLQLCVPGLGPELEAAAAAMHPLPGAAGEQYEQQQQPQEQQQPEPQALPAGTVAVGAGGQVLRIMDVGEDPAGGALVMAASLGSLLLHPSLMPALGRRLRQPGGGAARAALAQQAVRAVKALPAAGNWAGVRLPDAFLSALTGTAGLLAASVNGALPPEGEPAVAGSSSQQEQEQREQTAVAWEVVRLVPHMAALLQACAADMRQQSPLDLMGTMQRFQRCIWVLQHLGPLHDTQRLADWAAAADAALRLLPLLARLQGDTSALAQPPGRLLQQQPQQHDQQQAQQAQQAQWDMCGAPDMAELLATQLLQAVWLRSSGLLAPRPISDCQVPGQPSLDAAAALLFQLHSSSCRLLHWLAAKDSCLARRLAAFFAGREGLTHLQVALNVQLCLASSVWERAEAAGAACGIERRCDMGHAAAIRPARHSGEQGCGRRAYCK